MKLQRAEEHLGQLVTEHDRFIHERNPYRMIPELDPDPGYDVLWRVKIVEHPPVEKWSSLTGECVHALRSALDYLALALVQIKRPADEYAEFPILKDKFVTDKNGATVLDKATGRPVLRWEKEAPRKLRGVGGGALTQIRWLQPYRRRDGAERFHDLWLIHHMDVIDKHRRPNIVGPFVRGLAYHTTGCEIIADERLAGPFKDGTSIARYRARSTGGPQMNVTTEFAFDVRFGDREPLDGEPVLERLRGLLAYTGYVISRFDRFFT